MREKEYLGESSLICFVDFVSFLLVVVELRSNVVQKDLNLTDWASSLEVELEHREDGISEMALIDLSKNLSWVFSLVGVSS